VIYSVDPIDVPFIASIAQTNATAVLHEWTTQALGAPSASNAVLEGDDATTDAATAAVKVSNSNQISDKVARVTGTQRAVISAGREDELEYQVYLKTLELRRDMETNALAHVAEVTGDSTTARKYGTLGTWLTSNLNEASDATSSTGLGNNKRTDGTIRALTESLVKDALKQTFDAGGDPDCMIMGSFNKQAVSGFGGNATRVKTAEDRKLQTAIDLYESDFGDLQIIPDRFARPALGGSDATGDLWIVQKDMVALAYLRNVGIEPLSKTGDSDRRQILVEYTLECRNEKAHGAVLDLTIS